MVAATDGPAGGAGTGFLSELGRSFFSPSTGSAGTAGTGVGGPSGVDPATDVAPFDPATDAGYTDHPKRKGFFTDTSVCIGCKACEVACKEWNAIPEDGISLTGMSYDNTGALGGSTWRHVKFIEQQLPEFGAAQAAPPSAPSRPQPVDLGMPTAPPTSGIGNSPDVSAAGGEQPAHPDFRWLMDSDVCKHCTHAACLDVCPTGALFRTEFGTVVVQDDICNGCGYCVPACPYGVIERRDGPPEDPAVGLAQKCTLCYDRLSDGMEPACAKACPTESIQFGDLDELRERAQGRLDQLVEAGEPNAQLYGHDDQNGVGGTGAFFLLLDEPEVYGLPPDPVVTTKDLPGMWRQAALAAGTLLAGAAAAFVGARGGSR